MLSKMNKIGKLALLALVATAIAPAANAGDYKVEARFQHALERSRAAISLIRGAPEESITKDLVRLKTMAREILSAHSLLEDKFERRSEIVKEIGPKAVKRHAQMMESYHRFISELETLVDTEELSPEGVKSLNTLMLGAMPRGNRPIYGSIPYKHLNWPAREPLMEPVVTPAYRGGDTQVTVDDTASTPEAPISKEISELAESLEWNPVKIYEYVKNSVETEWYYGCMKGAEETLRQGSGNDCDQATLLVALLRASNYPTRYVRGVIEFFPDIETAKNLTGVDDSTQLGEFFQKAGIPFRMLIAGGKVSNYQIEHIWVETRVPYDNYRGVVVDEAGKAWLGLDTSIKAGGFTYNEPEEIPGDFPLSQIRDFYLQADRPDTPLEYLRAEMEVHLDQNQPDISYADLLRTRTQNPEEMKILPASLQFEQVAVTGEYTSIPDELIHKARFTASDRQGGTLFDVTIDNLDLSNRSIAVYYEPDTVEDQEIINSFGGLDNTPAYLVRLRPVLRVNGERLAVGLDGLAMGEGAVLTVELISPHGTELVTNDLIVGNLVVMGLVAQKALSPESMPAEDKNAERLMHEETLSYINRWHAAEDELASLLRLSTARPLPALVTMGGVIEVTYLLDMPHGYEWRGVFVDADQNAIEAFGDPLKRITFMRLSSLQGSVLEDRVLREDFLVDSISTARLFALAQSNQVPILTIDGSNVDTILPGLPFADNVKDDIANAVNQGLVVTIPDREVVYEDWAGVGYIKENPDTAESGWMLSGMIAGGMSALGPPRWDELFFGKLSNPFSEIADEKKPQTAVYIQKVFETDGQEGIVGKKLEETGGRPLQVVVLDKDRNRVWGAPVLFTIKSGDGWLVDPDTGALVKSIQAESKQNGFASVSLVLGIDTSINPGYILEEGGKYPQQVGLNHVDAELKDTGAVIAAPFEALAYPDKESATLSIEHGDDMWSAVLSYVGTISVSIEDRYYNPVSNIPIVFQVDSVDERQDCTKDNADTRPALLIGMEEPCLKGIPRYGQCGIPDGPLYDQSNPSGAWAGVIMGGVPGADYSIVVNAMHPDGRNEFVSFTLHTNDFGNCDGKSEPASKFVFGLLQHIDEDDNILDAGKAGTEIELSAMMHFLVEKDDPEKVTDACGLGRECAKSYGSREYFIQTELLDAFVTFGGVLSQGSDGIYTAIYGLDKKPGKYTIDVFGTGDIEMALWKVECAEDPPCFLTIEKQFGELVDPPPQMSFYSVDVKFGDDPASPVSQYYVPVDKDGYVTQDTEIKFNIQPTDYHAISSYVVILEDVDENLEGGHPVDYIPAEKTGQGFVTISRGARFEADTNYAAYVLLNSGTQFEIISDRILLHIRRASIVPITLGKSGQLNRHDIGKIYNPTIMNGKLIISGSDIQLFYDQGNDISTQVEELIRRDMFTENRIAMGNPCEYDVPENKKGWYFIKISSENITTIDTSFSQESCLSRMKDGVSANDVWNSWYWPRDDGVDPNMFDEVVVYETPPGPEDGPLVKYDDFVGIEEPNIDSSRVWEFDNMRLPPGEDPKAGMCDATTMAGFEESRPIGSKVLIDTTDSEIIFREQDRLGLCAERYWITTGGEVGKYEDNVDEPGTERHVFRKCGKDFLFAGWFHHKLIKRINNDDKGIIVHFQEDNINCGVYCYEAYLEADGTDNVSNRMITVINSLRYKDWSIWHGQERIITTQYKLLFRPDGALPDDSTGELEWPIRPECVFYKNPDGPLVNPKLSKEILELICR